MSTRTSNLQLHLWAEDDYVLMSDFNADHAAIDAYVTTAANNAAAMKQELLEGQQRSNLNLFRLLAPDYFAGNYAGTPGAMVLCPLDSAAEAGTCTGFVWKEHPIKLGLYSGGLAGSTPHPDLDIHDASIARAVTLDGAYTQATLVVQAHGWYSKTPPMSTAAARVEDYTGITVAATLGGAAMTPGAVNAAAWPGDESVPLREFVFTQTGDFDETTQLSIHFHCPADRGLWIYSWALILA